MPSGNGCAVYLHKDDMERNLGQVEWDKHPPSAEDLRFYEDTVVPIFVTKLSKF